ncbi:Autophagy protein 7 [Coccidioides posadasii str. Silveira]|uniref:Ubiquitin-like modifier-activating enzyme ATG7 n=3 Tax=Coccidioides posadasii TaxID=199306 RepID=E9CSC8_COCPS|nr:ThiF family protein [Coccidioides posadasii C735 delta SOWgp]EER28207.1 ThiF family protein [Coccidioides posadasii C735 delta SOWgp]EFW23398.1 autophagy protein Atg7p [Coccidioides posadasii str. Silveira]KMM68265.1 Apg7p [Coccidioides posadasii RMSCC 3488]QVM12254.1 Autophagy protein 7 [Coccidioides posadasii str. Silveira]|eukprot:XP_003070352.1 ThiF family protein [Coccidioides posadasii C735 delta SOWgp]
MQYTPFISDIEIPFFSSLATLKLNHDKLDDSIHNILGFYEVRPSDPQEVSCRMQVPGNALVADKVPFGAFRAEGVIKNFNTAEEYRIVDKSAMLHDAGKRIWDAIMDGSVYSSPSLLASFLMLSFADLKKYRFSYWFAFPAIHSNPPWVPSPVHHDSRDLDKSENAIHQSSFSLTNSDRDALVDAVLAWRSTVEPRQHGFFLARRVRHLPSQPQLESNIPTDPGSNASPLQAPDYNKCNCTWEVSSLSTYENGFFGNAAAEDCFICFVDPSNYPDAPGWMLRNLLILIRHKWRLNKVQIIRYREIPSFAMEPQSTVMILKSDTSIDDSFSRSGSLVMPKLSGWERNANGKLSGRLINLTEHMDPERIADQSVDLNLKLMKWRITPSLNLDVIKRTKCLLLGAGTLGCYVARNLLAWGVQTINFVDNGSVSFSNPVRQPLFGFHDCLYGGAKKAVRAAEALQEIYPGVCSTGHVLSIPMVGHPMVNNNDAKSDYEHLKNLIDQHDAIFLLMDSRESRWLPTVMGKAAGKMVMNAALGFDTFVVMRHGTTARRQESVLGCYFCNDIVAPANSTRVQTLDQQCTVTRPGVASMASALLVELFVSALQQFNTPPAPDSSSHEENSSHPLGIVPHQIRGFLSTFSNVVVTGQSYEFCSACSNNIVHAYITDGWEFVQRAINENGYIEEVSGLKKVQQSAEEAIASLELEDPLDSEGEML